MSVYPVSIAVCRSGVRDASRGEGKRYVPNPMEGIDVRGGIGDGESWEDAGSGNVDGSDINEILYLIVCPIWSY